MFKVFRDAVVYNAPFWVLTISAIGLIIASFIVPPLGVISPTVLTAVGEIIGLGALWTVVKAIDKGTNAKVSHNGTEVEIKGKDE